VRPVFSNLGEPTLTAEALEKRDPHRWVVCGGSELAWRSVRSLLKIADSIEAICRPRELFVIGGRHQRDLAASLRAAKGIETSYRPEVSVAEASEILAGAGFGWIDYFVQPQAPLPTILKSSAFAALCAHGVVPVFPRPGAIIAHQGESLPGPFFVRAGEQCLPPEQERGAIAQSIYSWYRRHAFSGGLADLVWSELASE
jgi:hypothetical protein